MSSDISQSLSIVLLQYLDAILGTYLDVEEYRQVRVVAHTLSTSYSSRDLISFSRHCSYIQHYYNRGYCVVVKEEAFLLWQFLNLIRTSSAEVFTWRLFHSNSSTAPLVFRKIYTSGRWVGSSSENILRSELSVFQTKAYYCTYRTYIYR